MTSTPTDITYDYKSEAPLESRIHYNYAPNHGQPFLDAWQLQRQNIARQLPNPIKHQITKALPLPELETHVQTRELLNALLVHASNEPEASSLAHAWLKLLVGKFETTGRLHEEYNARFLAADKTRCRDINLYVTFCEILVTAQKDSLNLLYFNALLKGLDVLCSLNNELDSDAAGRTAYLIEREAALSQRLLSSLDGLP
jgi:hypothetical protein